MRMKEDHMLNGQLKPGYNIQVGTENNFVIGYDVFPNPTDTRTFIPHLENVQKRLGCKFKFAIADAGYGSEENYDYLEKNEITGIVKYTTYEKEIKRSFLFLFLAKLCRQRCHNHFYHILTICYTSPLIIYSIYYSTFATRVFIYVIVSTSSQIFKMQSTNNFNIIQ